MAISIPKRRAPASSSVFPDLTAHIAMGPMKQKTLIHTTTNYLACSGSERAGRVKGVKMMYWAPGS